MNLFSALVHIFNFVLPAIFVAGVVCLLSPWLVRLPYKRKASKALVQWLITSLVGIAILFGGLWFFGVDGKMMTYGVLVLAIAITQMLLLAKGESSR